MKFKYLNMNLNTSEEKRNTRKKRLVAAAKACGIGIVEGGLSTGIAILPVVISTLNDNYVFGVLIIWLVFGWFSTYFISLNTLEILATIISGSVISLIIYYFVNVHWWIISLIIGMSMLFWVISFITKIFIFPPKHLQKSEEESK